MLKRPIKALTCNLVDRGPVRVNKLIMSKCFNLAGMWNPELIFSHEPGSLRPLEYSMRAFAHRRASI